MGNKSGLMVINTKDIGNRTSVMVRENSCIRMETFTRVCGKMIKLMVMVVTRILMVVYMLESGRMLNSMELEKNHFQMEHFMQDIT